MKRLTAALAKTARRPVGNFFWVTEKEKRRALIIIKWFEFRFLPDGEKWKTKIEDPFRVFTAKKNEKRK